MDPSSFLQRLSDGDIVDLVSEVKAALADPDCSSLARRALPRISNLCVACKGRTEPFVKDDFEALQLALLCSEAIHADSKGHTFIECDARVIKSVYAILARFYRKGNTVCSVKLLDAYVPLLKKMAPFKSEADYLHVNQSFSLVCRLFHSASDSIFKANSQIVPLDLWNIILQLSALVPSYESITSVFTMMKFLSIKNQEWNQHSSFKNVEDFNLQLLDKLDHLEVSNVIAKEEDVDKLFAALVTCLWQFLRSDLSSNKAKNWEVMLQSFSSFVYSSITCNQHHLSCFSLITRIFRASLLSLDEPSSEETFCPELQSLLSSVRSHEKLGKTPAFMWVLYSGKCAVNALETFAYESVACRSFLTPKTLSSIFNFAKIVSESYLSCDTSCSWNVNGEVCQHKGDIYMAFKTMQTIVNICFKYKKDHLKEWSDLLPLIGHSIDFLEKICNKASIAECLKSEMLKKIFYTNCYQVGCTCFKFHIWKDGQEFLLQSCKYVFAGNGDISSFQQDLPCTLSKLSICCEKQRLYKEAKVAILLDVVVNLKNGRSHHLQSRDQWCSVQNADPTGTWTLVQLAERESTTLKSIWPDFFLDPKYLPSMLLWELSCYVCHRMKSTDIILKAWTALKAAKSSSLFLLEGSALACQALFSCCDSVDWYDLVGGSISSWLSEVQEDQKPVALCAMAIHYYAKFLIQAQSHFDENESKVVDVQLYSHNPATVRQPKDVINNDDVCQVRSHFLNLNLKREEKLMDLLESSINYWNDSFQAGLTVGDYGQHLVVSASGDYLLQIAHLYILWGYHAGAAKAFQLCSDFAKKMGLDALLLQALSGLMSTIEVNRDFILETERLVETLRDHPKSSQLFQVYHASRAFQALRTNSHADGFSALKNVLDVTPTSSTIWCYAYIKFLQASYASFHKPKVDESQFIANDTAAIGLSTVIHHLQEKKLSHSPLNFANLVNQALSLALWIGRFYLKRQMPREARCYLKVELMLALKLGLATRAAEFICELAFVDLLTENVDETASKISDLHSILGPADTSASNNDAIDDAIDEADDFLVVRPHHVCPKKEVPTLGSSPLLNESEFSMPLIKHGSLCQCYSCKNCSVQNIWLMSGHLQAKINMLRFYLDKSMKIYQQCFKAVPRILQQLSLRVHSPGRLLQQHQVACTEIGLRLDFVDMLVVYAKDQQALKKNEAIFDLLKNLQTSEKQLMAEALEQKMCIINLVEKETIKRKAILFDEARVSPYKFHEKTPDRNMDLLTPRPPGKGKRLPLTPLKTTNNRLPPTLQFNHHKARFDLSPKIVMADEIPMAPRKIHGAPQKKTDPNQEMFEKGSSLFNPPQEEGMNQNAKSTVSKLSVSGKVPQGKQAGTSKLPTLAKRKISSTQVPTSTKNVSSNIQESAQKIKLEARVTKPEKAESLKSKKKASSKLTSNTTENTRRTTRSACLEKK